VSLKEAISVKHKEAENTAFNKKLINGELDAYQYVNYLYEMLAVFSTLEERMAEEIPGDMKRSLKIIVDISEIVTVEDFYFTKLNLKTLDSTVKYCEYLETVEDLWPHVYLNYMAILFGGQAIKKVVPGSGRFYYFDNPGEYITFIRSKQKDEWAEEVNRGFDYIIKIYNELYDVNL
jgi:heme oxygenase